MLQSSWQTCWEYLQWDCIFGYFRVHACVHITTYLQITVRLADIFFFQEHVCLCVYSKMTEYIIQQEFQVWSHLLRVCDHTFMNHNITYRVVTLWLVFCELSQPDKFPQTVSNNLNLKCFKWIVEDQNFVWCNKQEKFNST